MGMTIAAIYQASSYSAVNYLIFTVLLYSFYIDGCRTSILPHILANFWITGFLLWQCGHLKFLLASLNIFLKSAKRVI